MKRIRIQPTIFALLLLLVATVAGMGRPTAAPFQGPGGPGRPEIKAYLKQNVLPVVRRQRQQLEPLLSAADQAQLAGYRTQLRAIRQQRQALQQSIGATAAPDSALPALTAVQRQQAQQLRTQARTILLSVAQLAQKYETAIAQQLVQLQPQKEQWASDIEAIVLKHATPEQQQQLSRFAGRRGHRGGAVNGLFRPVAFLLLAPSTPGTTGQLGKPTTLYPNPAGATAQLDYRVEKAGAVTINLLDSRGQLLRTLATEAQQAPGTHTKQVALGDLQAGTYYYQITTRAGTETKRFLKE
ncbi:T9SS type A sorting domain-containing protein [Hymenobacter canadensis]|uniref:T9SS type A sorting domain-containing protein n=1 Tax=Hymenobacter canadensis TaxID=2999067 RepID=A0ABY7LZC7_9BACT|nr:T9SS type A sorting domain-containing protein [Hymenobacter canadensis]WBA44115.1 T9SS type A sorting domain-containing protein [Hymenobacter canadensis]